MWAQGGRRGERTSREACLRAQNDLRICSKCQNHPALPQGTPRLVAHQCRETSSVPLRLTDFYKSNCPPHSSFSMAKSDPSQAPPPSPPNTHPITAHCPQTTAFPERQEEKSYKSEHLPLGDPSRTPCLSCGSPMTHSTYTPLVLEKIRMDPGFPKDTLIPRDMSFQQTSRLPY